MTYIPFFLHIGPAERIVIIGGGRIALAKAEALKSAAKSLHFVTENASEPLVDWAKAEGGSVTRASYHRSHLLGAKLVIAATDKPEVNRQIQEDAKELGIPVNVVDTPELCDFIFPAVVERGPVKIAISTAGVSPTLARLIKRRIEQLLPWNFGQLTDWIALRRSSVQRKYKSLQSRRLFWEEVLSGPTAQEVLEGNYAKADKLFACALEETPDAARGALWLVGAGPGHPDLITVRAAQLLSQADVILYDRLVAPDLLSRYARKEASKIAVGKRPGHHSKKQEEIDELLKMHLRKNRIVVRLKGGDPGIYAHAAEEIGIAAKLGVPWQIVPGVTAALGCAAAAGIPLTERGGASGVRFITLYEEQLHDARFWQSLGLGAQETLVFYMTTKARRAICERLLAAGLKPETPILAIEQGTTPYHAEYEATLATFGERYGDYPFITPALLIVGDVVRWREAHGWRQQAQAREEFFPPLEKAVAHAS